MKRFNFIVYYSFLLQKSQPKDKLTDEEIVPYLNVRYRLLYHLNVNFTAENHASRGDC